MARYNLNEELKARKSTQTSENAAGEIKLDDVSRVKVLSPTRQVIKRFRRNRLAIVGSVILIAMFVFCFIGPIFYAYGQKEIFHTYQAQNVNYALAKVNTSFTGYDVDESVEFDTSEKNAMNSYIKNMIASEKDSFLAVGEESAVYIEKLGENIYSMSRADGAEICSIGGTEVEVGFYDLITKKVELAKGIEPIDGLDAAASKNITKTSESGSFEFGGTTYSFTKDSGKRYSLTKVDNGIVYANGATMDEGFEKTLTNAAQIGENFKYEGKNYVLSNVEEGAYKVFELKSTALGRVYSTLTFDGFETNVKVSDSFRSNALLAAYADGTFSADGEDYTISTEDGVLLVCKTDGTEFGEFSSMSIRRYSGADSMDYQLKKDISGAIAQMNEKGEKSTEIKTVLPQQIEDGEDAGKYVYDDDGNLIYVDSDLIITQRDTGEYVVNCEQIIFVIDRYASPTWEHLLGTDGDGMDVLARIMYGGQVSLMVGFVVIIIETFLGIIMGGISGYFGGWVDTVIMRLVDIFYCLPSLPIMIIIGALMDANRVEPYTRLFIMMAALGIMGWAGVARLVRGQILSLREQEFMVATEATGVKVRARIFRHLIPNVMPQLIVTATMGLGDVILEESTLSFLGLGVKHPMATWGTMINSVSTASAMAHYAYIWIPVGLLICLTVIAFNFVGDGLRDAYDPRAKR